MAETGMERFELTDFRLTGGCQCGALRYVLTAPPLLAYACHCKECQRISASAFATSCSVLRETMHIEKGELGRIDWTVESGAHRYGEFCTVCGVRIRHGDEPSRGIFSLRGGTLDDKRWATPAAHTWQASALEWFTPPEGALLYDGQPTDYTPIMQRYAALMGLQ